MARNMRYTSDIQKNAQKIDAFLTPYLKSDIVAPDKLSISVQKMKMVHIIFHRFF